MALTSLGTVTNQHTGAGDPVNLTVSQTLSPGTVVIFAGGNDSNNVSVNLISDTGSNSWDGNDGTSSSGDANCSWMRVATTLDIGDTITIDWSGATDSCARCYGFRGISDSEIRRGTKAYTESTTYSLSLNNTSSSDAVMFAVFHFPFDYGISTFPSGWTRFADITDGTDQQMLGFYKDVTTGTHTCSATVGTTVAYIAAGVILPYSNIANRGQAVVVF